VSRSVQRLLPPLAIVAAAAWLGSTPSPGHGQDAADASASPQLALSRTLPRAIERAAPCVVLIRRAGDSPAARRSGRSGVLVSKGVVVTSFANVDVFGLEDLVVEDAGGETHPAKVRGRDLRTQIVALHVPTLSSEPPPLSTGPRLRGTFVLALGSPLRAGGLPTATFGILSATGRFQGRADQLDAALDASNLGGALVDMEGRLRGVLVHVDARLGDRSGVGFAIPAHHITPVLDRLLRGDELEPGYLGLEIPRAGIGDTGGVEIRTVALQGPANAAGLRPGDRIVRLGAYPTPDRRAFRAASAFLYAGQEIELEILHDGARRTVKLVVLPRD